MENSNKMKISIPKPCHELEQDYTKGEVQALPDMAQTTTDTLKVQQKMRKLKTEKNKLF